jgi:hypothetical protein
MAHPLSSYSIELGNMEPPRPRKPTFTDLPDDAISSIIEKGLDCTSNSGAYLSRNDFKLLTGFSSISKGVRDVARRVAEEQPAYLKVCVRTRAGMGDEFTGLFPRPAAELPSCLRWLRSAPRVDWLRVEIGGLSPSDTAALRQAAMRLPRRCQVSPRRPRSLSPAAPPGAPRLRHCRDVL